MAGNKTHQVIETVFRMEQPRLIAGLARLVRDVGLAEELAQDALLIALDAWPKSGVPQNPGAWLMTVAKHRAIDRLRRRQMRALKLARIGHEPAPPAQEIEAVLDEDLGDELLALIFAACHPVLSPEARVALTLRLIGGLSTEEIARAFLATEPTIAQRIVRAKKSLSKAGLRFEVPHGAERLDRLGSVLAVIYLIFNEGYAATAGDDLIRPALCAEAQRLARMLAAAMPDEPEVMGLMALLELQASRLHARTDANGAPIRLPEQNRARWDWLLIHRGLAALARGEALGGARGPYALQAALAACHARARKPEDTDWHRIAALYDDLRLIQPSPVVDLNRAVAHSMAFGADAGLRLLATIEHDPALRHYAPLYAAKGDCLQRAGHPASARAAFERAAALSRNTRERAFLQARAAACSD